MIDDLYFDSGILDQWLPTLNQITFWGFTFFGIEREMSERTISANSDQPCLRSTEKYLSTRTAVQFPYAYFSNGEPESSWGRRTVRCEVVEFYVYSFSKIFASFFKLDKLFIWATIKLWSMAGFVAKGGLVTPNLSPSWWQMYPSICDSLLHP